MQEAIKKGGEGRAANRPGVVTERGGPAEVTIMRLTHAPSEHRNIDRNV